MWEESLSVVGVGGYQHRTKEADCLSDQSVCLFNLPHLFCCISKVAIAVVSGLWFPGGAGFLHPFECPLPHSQLPASQAPAFPLGPLTLPNLQAAKESP